MRSRLRVRRVAAEQEGFTLVEMLVVLAIVGIILAGITQLLTSALKSQTDQTNRSIAQQDARLALDKLRREIHCASAVDPMSGNRSSTITITLGNYCPTYPGVPTDPDAKVTWCVRDKNDQAPPTAGAPYSLWRNVGSTCSGSPQQWAANIVNAGAVTAGDIFSYSAPTQPAMSPPLLTLSSAPGSLGSPSADTSLGYVVDPVTAAGEQPGLEATVTLAAGTTGKAVTLDWSGSCPPYSGVTAYKVYGRTPGGEQLLGTPTPATGCQFTDTGAGPLPGPSPVGSVLARIGVDIPVRVGASGTGLAELRDDIALRNTPR